MAEPPYKMTLNLNVLNHLGFNLYSNVPAVLSEVVANAWDADSEHVTVTMESDNKKIVITDDGHGMTKKDINERFLHVGYLRRSLPGGEKTLKHGRDVMGKKGIGKLSVFSIAEEVEVHSVKGGQKSGFKMILEDIQAAITGKGEHGADYFPPAVPSESIQIEKGTKITLTKLKKNLAQTENALRKRLARRFAILEKEYEFQVEINGRPVTVLDRDYFHKIQYLWWFGDDSQKYQHYCTNSEKDEKRSSKLEGTTYSIKGWIGTVDSSGKLKEEDENLNKIVLMARGKLVQEDILEDFGEGGVYSKYLIGEIHAEFLDLNDQEDILTTSRQRIIEDSRRYQILKRFVLQELKHIQSKWTDWRNEAGEAEARRLPAIDEWVKTLSKDNQRRARSLFGKINTIAVDSPDHKLTMFKHGILAFETLRYRENLDALERVSQDNLAGFIEVFTELDDLEATLYYQIVQERLQVIEALVQKVDEDAREKVIQQHLFNHLWLLDPSWERGTETEYMEKRVTEEFGKLDAKLTPVEKAGRLDIKYKTTAKKHVIIELKRADRSVESEELQVQVRKYMRALKKILDEVGQGKEPIEAVCVVGRKPKDWTDPGEEDQARNSMAQHGIRVVTYQELIQNAHKAYRAYFEKKREAGRIFEILKKLETSADFQ